MTERRYSAQSRNGPKGVLNDLAQGLARGPVWRSFAWDEIQNRYRRSALGLAWIGISYLFFVVVIVIFFRGLSQSNPQYFLIHVAIGYAGFTFMVGNITDGCDVFRSATTWIKSTPLPYSIYIYKSIFRSLFTFAIQLFVGLVIIAINGWRPSVSIFMVLPALAIFLLNAVAIQLFFGLVATRYRDFSHLVSTLTRILFFMTPILWTLEQRSGLIRQLALVNPLTHYLEIFRAPIANTPIMPESWPIVILLTILIWVLAIGAGSFMSRRLPFWL